MTKLSVNVNKIATLRNSRGKDKPQVVQVAKDIVAFGAHGITVHPRPDGRHIRVQDVYDLDRLLRSLRSQSVYRDIEFNIEGNPTADFLKLIADVKPDQCTLVPDAPQALTSNAGWDVVENYELLVDVLGQLRSHGVRSSIFVDPLHWNQDAARRLEELRPDRVEIYTEAFAEAYSHGRADGVLSVYSAFARSMKAAGIGLNAGHDLDLANVGQLKASLPDLLEVSIGHALICEALYIGLEQTIHDYLRILS